MSVVSLDHPFGSPLIGRSGPPPSVEHQIFSRFVVELPVVVGHFLPLQDRSLRVADKIIAGRSFWDDTDDVGFRAVIRKS